MDTLFLETFLAVIDCGSIAAAARQLDLAPTTVAQQIKALEKQLDNALLRRSGHTVKPTAAAHRIIERARLIVREARDLRASASSGVLPVGPLRLGATQYALMQLLPPALHEWRRRYPEIEIYIEPGNSQELMEQVVSGDLDAALIVHPLFALPKSCEWVALVEEPLVLITPTAMQVEDVLATIVEEPFIRFSRKVVGGKLVEAYLQGHGLKPKSQFELDGIDIIVKFVAEGLGVALVPDRPEANHEAQGVRRWEVPGPRLFRTLGIVWQRASVRAPLVVALNELMAEGTERGPL